MSGRGASALRSHSTSDGSTDSLPLSFTASAACTLVARRRHNPLPIETSQAQTLVNKHNQHDSAYAPPRLAMSAAHLTQKMAVPLRCELTPRGTLLGADVKKKNQRPSARHVALARSRSTISPSGMPHSAKMCSCSCVVPAAEAGHASNAGMSPPTLAK